jgi:hypothetical protein
MILRSTHQPGCLDYKVNILSQKQTSQTLVAHTCNPSYSGGRNQEDLSSKPAWANSLTLSQKYATQKRTDSVAQVVERLPTKCEIMSSNHEFKKGEANEQLPQRLFKSCYSYAPKKKITFS